MIDETVGERITRLRKKMGISQRTFARVCGVSYSSISRIEAGVTDFPKLNTIRRIEKTFKKKVFF